MLPPCFPPGSTVRRCFYLWRDNGFWQTLNHSLLITMREINGREASPSVGVIDSQSVKTTGSGGPCGCGAGKKIKGRMRPILTDTEGNLVDAIVHTADIQDRDGAPLLLAEIIKRYLWLRHLFAHGGYAGDKLRKALCASANGPSISSSDQMLQKASRSCPAGGSSNEPWLGSTATAASSRTSNKPSRPPPLGCSSHPSSSSLAGSEGIAINRTSFASDS